MLKVELHTHVQGDPQDSGFVKYSSKDLIDKASELKFDVLAITCHNLVHSTQEDVEYAKSKGILLIQGMEKTLQGKHTLIYNITNEQGQGINSFEDLILARKNDPNIFVIAPHPFYPDKSCHRKNIIKYLDMFDAWEHSFIYLKLYNPNKKVIKLAKKYDKPIVGNSDIHHLRDLGRTYSLIDADKNINSVFQAIKSKKVRIVTSPIPIKEICSITFGVIKGKIKKTFI